MIQRICLVFLSLFFNPYLQPSAFVPHCDYLQLFFPLAAPKGSSEKKTKGKARRDRRKVTRKRLPSADPQENFMAELPFCLTSPTTWKELGCACVRSSHHIASHHSLTTTVSHTTCRALFRPCLPRCCSAVPTPGSEQKKRKRKRDGGGRLDSEEDAVGKKKKKKGNQRPNYFISIPITNPQVENSSALRSSSLIKIFFSHAVQLGNRRQLRNTKPTPVYMYVFIERYHCQIVVC